MTSFENRLNKIREKWKWMPGMLAVSEQNYIRITKCMRNNKYYDIDSVEYGRIIAYCQSYINAEWSDHFHVPDITDPATKGCLINQLRETRPGSNISQAIMQIDDPSKDIRWHVFIPTRLNQSYDTEEKAIIAALEAA